MRFTKKELKEDYIFYPIWTGNSGWVANEATDKLGQLEDIEEELGIDLITLFKALKNGAYVKNYKEKQDLALKEDKLYLCPLDIYDDFVYIKDYGKTWVLTKEELL